MISEFYSFALKDEVAKFPGVGTSRWIGFPKPSAWIWGAIVGFNDLLIALSECFGFIVRIVVPNVSFGSFLQRFQWCADSGCWMTCFMGVANGMECWYLGLNFPEGSRK